MSIHIKSFLCHDRIEYKFNEILKQHTVYYTHNIFPYYVVKSLFSKRCCVIHVSSAIRATSVVSQHFKPHVYFSLAVDFLPLWIVTFLIQLKLIIVIVTANKIKTTRVFPLPVSRISKPHFLYSFEVISDSYNSRVGFNTPLIDTQLWICCNDEL